MNGTPVILVENKGSGPLTLEYVFTVRTEDLEAGLDAITETRSIELGDPWDYRAETAPQAHPRQEIEPAVWALIMEQHSDFISGLVNQQRLVVTSAMRS